MTGAKSSQQTDRGVFHCTQCDYTTTNIFQLGCPCGGSLFLPIDENPEFHSEGGSS